MYQSDSDQSIVHAATRIIDKNEETMIFYLNCYRQVSEVFKLKKITNYIIYWRISEKYTLKIDLMR